MPLITMLKKMTKGNNNIGKTVETHTSDIKINGHQKGNKNDEQNGHDDENNIEENNDATLVAISPSMPSSLYSRRTSGDEDSVLSSCGELSICRSISTTSESDIIRDIDQDLGKSVIVEEEEKSHNEKKEEKNPQEEVLFEKKVDENNVLKNEQNASLKPSVTQLDSTTSNTVQSELTCTDDKLGGGHLSQQKTISNFDNDEEEKKNNNNDNQTKVKEEQNNLNFCRRSDLPPLIRNTANTIAPLTQYEASYPLDPVQVCEMFFQDPSQQQQLISSAAHEMFLHTYYQFYGPEKRPATRGTVTCFTPCDVQRDVLVNDTWRDDSYYTSDGICFCNRCVFIEMSDHVARGGILPLPFGSAIPQYLPSLTNHCRSAKNRRILQPIAELPEKEEIALQTQIDLEEYTEQAVDTAMVEYVETIAACRKTDLNTARSLCRKWLESLPPSQRILYELYFARFNHGHLDAFHVDNIVYPFGYDLKNQTEVDIGRCNTEWQFKMIRKHQMLYRQALIEHQARGNALQQQINMLLSQQQQNRANGTANMKDDALKLSQIQLQIAQWTNNTPVAVNMGLHFMANWQLAIARPTWGGRGIRDKMSSPQHRILQRYCFAKKGKNNKTKQ
eukprot:UN01451